MNPTGFARSLWKSAALKAGLAFASSGAALAAGNLILARSLPTGEFARFAVFIALVQIGISVGPWGADVIMVRLHLDPDAPLRRRVLKHSTVVAVLLAIMTLAIYQLSLDLIVLLAVAVVAGSVKVVPISHLRSQQRFGRALLLSVSTNASVLVAAVAAMIAGGGTTLLPAAAMTLALVLTAIVGARAVATTAAGPAATLAPYPMSDAFSAVSFIAAGMILTSLDRLITPKLMGLPAVATLSVLSTIAGSPFHTLHLGIGYTLVPALRNATDRLARKRVLRHESWIVGGACLISTLAIWMVTPFVLRFILNSRYDIPWQLLVAAICLGLLKVVGTLCAGAINALGSSADLGRLSVAGWIAIAVAAIGGCIGSLYGLTGLLYGVTLGWLARALTLGVMARRILSADRPSTLPLAPRNSEA